MPGALSRWRGGRGQVRSGALGGDAAAVVAQDLLDIQAPPPQRPAVQPTALVGKGGGRYRKDRAQRVGHAVPAHPAVTRPGHEATLARTHDEQVTGLAGEGDQDRPWLAALHDRLDGKVGGDLTPGRLKRRPQPLPGGILPDLDQGRAGLPGGKLTAGRYPGQNGCQGGNTVAGQVLRVPQRPEAARRAARADDDPAYAGHAALLPRWDAQPARRGVADPSYNCVATNCGNRLGTNCLQNHSPATDSSPPAGLLHLPARAATRRSTRQPGVVQGTVETSGGAGPRRPAYRPTRGLPREERAHIPARWDTREPGGKARRYGLRATPP